MYPLAFILVQRMGDDGARPRVSETSYETQLEKVPSSSVSVALNLQNDPHRSPMQNPTLNHPTCQAELYASTSLASKIGRDSSGENYIA